MPNDRRRLDKETVISQSPVQFEARDSGLPLNFRTEGPARIPAVIFDRGLIPFRSPPLT